MTSTTTTAPGPPDRFRRFDPLLVISCTVALVVYVLHGFDGYLSRDLGVYTYGGQQVAEGVPPYVAILNRAGPLGHLIPGIGAFAARTIGADDILGMRVMLMLVSIAAIGVTYLLGRDLFRSRLAGVASAAALLATEEFSRYATYGPREKTSMVLFLLCALLAMVHQRWGTTGFFIALATLSWQPVFIAAIPAAVTAVLLGLHTGRIRALLRIAVGGLIPSAVTVGAYAAVGALQIFLDDFLLINARYTKQSSMLDSPGYLWQKMTESWGWSFYVFLVGLVALLVLGTQALRRTSRREPLSAALVGLVVLFLVGVLWSWRAFNGSPDAFFMLPGAVLGIGGIAAVLARRVPARAALAATLAWVVAATAMSLVYAIGSRDDTLNDQRADVAAVLDLLPPDARILTVEAPQPLVLAHERNLSRYQLFGNGLIDYVDDTWPGGSEGYGRWIARQEPTIITLGGETVPTWLAPTLDGTYRRVGASLGWAWYVRADVGQPTRQALRAVLHGKPDVEGSPT